MKTYELPAEQRAFIETLRQPFAVCQFTDESVVALAVSDGFLELFDFDDHKQATDAMNHYMFKDVHPEDTSLFTNALLRFGADGEKLDVVYRTRKGDGSGYMVVHLSGEHIEAEDGVELAQIWFTLEGDVVDLGEPDAQRQIARELREESLDAASRYDYLTGLPTMAHFFVRAEIVRKQLLDEGGLPALLYIDLNGMKFYNHRYGFSAGDILLRRFARFLGATFGTENCCHVAADRFAAVTDEERLEERLEAMFGQWHEMNPERHLPICAGIYPNRLGEVPVGLAYDRAKIACDALKGTFVSGFTYYSSEMNADFEKRRYIMETFDRALDEHWICVYYQPILRPINKKVCHDEALARWIDPERGFLSPADFIPYLEDAGLIYKLDLYILDRVLEDMRTQEEAGLFVVPHSINLSRSDFDACDIVKEIRSRVDGAGIARDKICVEITESVIGTNFDFMKEQVERFQALGFPVWMDDFGSGYSSLDVLQSIKFDLLKFDMNFMRRLDESSDGRIIMTELMKMATALGVDTICEGVETAEQAHFLQEIGCSKQQGFYYSRPTSFEDSMVWHVEHKHDGYENPAESAYYEAICGVNLFDVGVIAQDERHALNNAFSTLPIGIVEVKGGCSRFVRTNQAYRDFFRSFFGIDIASLGPEFMPFGANFMNHVVRTCCEKGLRSFYDEKMPDGSVVHSFARRIAINPLTGEIAVAIAVLSVSEPDESASYVDIARALASDYYTMYVVDLETEHYIEYSSTVGGQDVVVESHGEDFFAECLKNYERIYEKDREAFFGVFTKDQIVRVLDEQSVFNATYRRMDTGKPVYVTMKVTRLQPSRTKIIIGVSVVDAQMRQLESLERMRRERAALVRVMALSDGYLALYTVDPDGDSYVEFTSSDDYATLDAPKEGDGFFEQLQDNAQRYLHADDLEAFLSCFSRERVMAAIEEDGHFSTNFRIMFGGTPQHVVMRIAPFTEGEETKLLVGIRKWRERRTK